MPLSPLTSPLLNTVRHAFFTRQGGVSNGLYASLNGGTGSRDEPSYVEKNRALMAEYMGVEPDHLLSLYQIHSPLVVTVSRAWGATTRPQADAMVTKEKGLALAIATADCCPVLFADDQAKVIGAAHAGWKGALQGVLEATISAMEELGASRNRIKAVLGPTISGPSYEVGPEFVERFIREDESYARFFTPAPRDKSFFDLPAFIKHRLEKLNIAAFEDLGLCTLKDETHFYSYRRATLRGEEDYGRLISAIGL